MARLMYIITIVSIASMCILAEELYSDKYDYIDALAILQNDSLRDQYYKCFMEMGPCTSEDMKFFKGIFMEAVDTNCKKCTEKQKKMLDMIRNWHTKNKPEEWQAIQKFIDESKNKAAGR